MEKISKHFIWSEAYRPKTVSECILPVALKEIFQSYVDQQNVPNMIMVGRAGTGKTTVAKAMLNQIDCDYIFVNASKEGNIETLRTRIQDFASSVAFHGHRKYVILDEADGLTVATQPALRNFMEEYASNCGFILTANYPSKIIPELHSRAPLIEFRASKEEAPKLASQFLRRVVEILDLEGKKYDKAVIAALIQKYYPDFRRVLGELQAKSRNGVIDTGVLTDEEHQIVDLMSFMREKNYTKVRQWAADNTHYNDGIFYRTLYDQASKFFKPSYVPEFIMAVNKAQFQSPFCFDKEINFVATMTEVMVTADWK